MLRAYCALTSVFAAFLLLIGITLTLGVLAIPPTTSIAFPLTGAILIFMSIVFAITAIVLFVCLKKNRRFSERFMDVETQPVAEISEELTPRRPISKSRKTNDVMMKTIKENGSVSKTSQLPGVQSESDILSNSLRSHHSLTSVKTI